MIATLRRADGTVLHCELAHLGVDERGYDHWQIANIVYHDGDSITIDEFPGQTVVGFATDGCAGPDVDWRAE